jgi:hypothetical protein
MIKQEVIKAARKWKNCSGFFITRTLNSLLALQCEMIHKKQEERVTWWQAAFMQVPVEQSGLRIARKALCSFNSLTI